MGKVGELEGGRWEGEMWEEGIVVVVEYVYFTFFEMKLRPVAFVVWIS